MNAIFDAANKTMRGKFLLKFDGVDTIPEKNLQEFINHFFNYNRMYSSVFAARTMHPKKALAKVVGKEQTLKGKRRSIEDIFRIARFYFPNVTVIDVFKALAERIKEKTLNSSYCNQTNKRMYYAPPPNYDNGLGKVFDREKKDEFGLLWKEWRAECGLPIEQE